MSELVRTAAVRAVKTFAQTLAALLTAAGTGLLDSDWVTSLSVAGMAAFLSILTTIGGEYVPERDEEGAVDPGSLALGLVLGAALIWLIVR